MGCSITQHNTNEYRSQCWNMLSTAQKEQSNTRFMLQNSVRKIWQLYTITPTQDGKMCSWQEWQIRWWYIFYGGSIFQFHFIMVFKLMWLCWQIQLWIWFFLAAPNLALTSFFFFFNASPAVFAWKTYVFPIHPEIDPALPRMKEPAADTAGLVQQASTMH